MRPVNLLPASERRRSGGAKRLENSSFVVLGILGVLLLGSLYYVSTGNKINTDKSAIAKAKQETVVAKARAAQLGPFAEFAKIKETRETSVKTLASQRFDWERLMREIGLVLPENTSIQTLSAATSGTPGEGGGSASTSTPAPAGGAGASATTPSMDLKGCAKKQDNVATMMVRLRALHGVDDVTLNDSEEPSRAGSGSSGTTAPTPSGGGSGTAQCKTYQFDVTVTFTATGNDDQQPAPRKVPRRLGGGA